MKIVHVIPNLMKGGAERLCIDICNELTSREGFEVKLIIFSNENLYQEITESIDIVHCPITFNLSITKSNHIDISSYSKFINSFQPDVIHSHLFRAELVTRFVISDNVRYITHIHDNVPQLHKGNSSTVLSKKKITNFYERNFLLKKYKKCNNHFISISKDTSTYLFNNLPNSLKNISLLKNAINLNKFTRQNTKLENRNTTLKLLTIGSLVDKKNHIFLVNVVKELIDKGLNPTLTILGEGPNRSLLEYAIEENNLKKYIQLIGNVNHIEEYMWNSDIYVHAAIYEPFGLVLLEAMAAGLPCVSIDGGGNRDIIQNEENGFILEKESLDLYVNSIIRLSTDDELLKKIVNNATKFVKNFGINDYVDKLIDIYNGVKKP